MEMFPELQSMVHLCQLAAGIATVYIGDLPEERELPALFFAPPGVVDAASTSGSFQKKYTLSLHILHLDNRQAFSSAEAVADAIRYPRYQIPLLDEAGEETGNQIRIEQLEVQMVEKGKAQLTLKWSSHHSFDRQTFDKIRRFTLTERMKTGGENEKDRRA